MERLWAPWRLAFIEGGEKPEGCIFCVFPADARDREHLVLGRSACSFVKPARISINTSCNS